MNVVGMNYMKISKYEVLSEHPLLEVSSSYEFIESIPCEGEYSQLPSLKVLSFDIECLGVNDTFPNSKRDPTIQIGNSLFTTDSGEAISRDIFCLKECSSISEANVFCYEEEKDLLTAWHDYFMRTDPDIIIGYNIKNFDFPYLFERAEVLGVSDFSTLGRGGKQAKVRDMFLSSKALGSRNNKEIEIVGRLIFDMSQVIRRDFNLRSYTLNAVSVHFLNEQKEDVPYSSMRRLQEGNKDTRKRLASYCLRDTYLPMRLFSKLNALINYSEMARVTGVPIEYLFTRGQAVKILSMIFRRAKAANYVIPVIDAMDMERSYEGGFVMDPARGYYSNPITTLDFSSLYPSIMIVNNLCYTTFLSDERYKDSVMGGEGIKKEDIIVTPTGNYFVKKNVREGLLPRILVDLIEERKKARRAIKETDIPELKLSLNARQLALKISANSVYGFTGATTGKLPCIEISQSVTGYGREMIGKTKRIIEETFCKKMGYSHDAEVIYGDTDSVMIDFHESDLSKVFEMSKEISKYVSDKFIKPISLEFEKVYCPYLLINKKRYAGLIYTRPDRPDKIDTKGIETVRRDNCDMVRNVIQTCLDFILFRKDLEGAKKFVKSVVRNLYTNKIDLSQLVISKALTKTGDEYLANQAHVVLAEKMKKRDKRSAPELGDRVPYIIVRGDKNKAAYEKSEDPIYVLENSLPIDIEYYLENQLSKPIHRLFEPIMENVNELFQGEHTRNVNVSVSTRGPMSAFLTKKETCIGCKSPGKTLCDKCRKDFPKHFLVLQKCVEEKKLVFSKCWVECQRCQGSIHNEILCVNRDCPIFYMRTKVKKEIIEEDEKLLRLKHLTW
jgi:DNA polymerase delta subunit 1